MSQPSSNPTPGGPALSGAGAEFRSATGRGHPFAFLDRLLELDPGRRVVAIKNVTYGEAILQGTATGRPTLPASLLLEALVQVACLASESGAATGLAEPNRRLRSVRHLVFHREAVPGDQVRLTAEIVAAEKSPTVARVSAAVGDALIAQGELELA